MESHISRKTTERGTHGVAVRTEIGVVRRKFQAVELI
jgi:hypothetical protein